jgi:hypothetical protein
MSQEALAKAVERASADAAFRAQLNSNPESALAGYDLTAEERAALMSEDASQMQSRGVDARISKQADSNTIDTPGGFSNNPWQG